MAPVVFVVSTGRTGTTFLAEFLASHGVDARHEPGPMKLRYASNAYVSGNLEDAKAVRLLEATRRDVIDGSRPYVESSCLLYGMVTPLLDTWPEAQVIHIVRDPRTYVRSGMNWGAYRFGGRPKNLRPYRRLAAPQFDPWSLSERVSWMARDQFQRLCWSWAEMNRAMRTQGDGEDRFTTVRFEDLFDEASGYPGLRLISSAAGLALSDDEIASFGSRKINPPKKSKFPNWTEWPADRLEYLVETCEGEAANYGYQLRSDVEKLLADR